MEHNKYYYNQQAAAAAANAAAAAQAAAAANMPTGYVLQNGMTTQPGMPGAPHHPAAAYQNVYQHVPNTIQYPPAYYQSAPHYTQQHYGFSGPPGATIQYVHVPQQQISYGAPLAAYHQPAMQQPQYNYIPAGATMPTAQFDEGARFKGKGGGALSIPPPAPGYAPTPAQIAAMQGRPVMTDKKKNEFLVGGKGGFTFW